MNRLHHLKHTLPKNIRDNRSHPNIEFIVLDYGSTDGLASWIKEEMMEYIQDGTLTFYQYNQATYFDRSHSRNLLFKLASGDIICNVDADNYLGEGFASYILSVFEEHENIFIIPDTKKRFYYIRDALGRFCIKKDDFLTIRGYDEKMKGYGFEDDDLYDRLIKSGKQEVIIQNLNFLNAIKHDNEDRIKNEIFATYLESTFIHFESLERSHVILLYKNGTFDKGTILPNQTGNASPAVLENLTWTTGTWKKEDHDVLLIGPDAKENLYDPKLDYLIYENKVYHKIQDLHFQERIHYDLPRITNYSNYLFNQKNRDKVNENGFGLGTVLKNFEKEKPTSTQTL